MKKLCALAAFSGFMLSCPAWAAKTFVIDQVIDLYPDSFNADGTKIDLGASALSKIASGDMVEGIVWFRRGHVRVYDPGYFNIRSWIEAPNATLRLASKSMSLLDSKGEPFGTPYYRDTLMVSVGDRAAAGPFDVYGFRYRIAFDTVVLGGNAQTADFVLKPVLYWGAYAPGDIFSSAVPEPSSWALMALGFAGLGLTMRRRRTSRPVMIA